MYYYALITLDLEPGASPGQREAFYSVLREREWEKLSDVTTAWNVEFNTGGFTLQEAQEELGKDLAAARRAANCDYTAAWLVGRTPVQTMSTE